MSFHLQGHAPTPIYPSASPLQSPSYPRPLSTAPSIQSPQSSTQNGSPSSTTTPAPRPKQKRNKPTLSCAECVERKTKCDRGRPRCLACLKRGSQCEYSSVANLLANTTDEKPSKARKLNKHLTPSSTTSTEDSSSKVSIANITHAPTAKGESPSLLRPQPTKTAVHLSSLAMENSAPISIFGVGREHPFGNYWTSTGGLAEVVGVLPTKEQADILVAKYFEIIDPMYPIFDRAEVLDTYMTFWRLPLEEKCKHDNAPIIALHFVFYANGTQFIEQGEPTDRARTAEFYLSAAHQALRIYSYWSHVNITTLQAMSMTFHFLVNDNHVSDAWVMSSITTRLAHVLQLNRDPRKIVPDAPPSEKQLRLILWNLLMVQDTGIALFLQLPSMSLHSDITNETFDFDADFSQDQRLPDPFSYPITILSPHIRQRDFNYSKCTWTIGKFVQANICEPRSLGLPVSESAEHKRKLVEEYRQMWKMFPAPFNSHDPTRFVGCNDARLCRQLISLANNYYHPMMLLHADKNPKAGVSIDIYGTLEAAHEALIAFFAMFDVFGSELNGFWAIQHRSFEVALTMANLLANFSATTPPTESGSNSLAPANWLLTTAKEDVKRMLDIIRSSSGYFEFQSAEERRLDTLRAVFQKITVV